MSSWLLVQRGSILSQPSGWTLRFLVSAWSILPLRLLSCPPLISIKASIMCFSASILYLSEIYQVVGGPHFQNNGFPNSLLVQIVLQTNVTKFILQEAINILQYYVQGLQCFIHANYHLVAYRKF